MVKTYCGNNLSFPGLISGTHTLGTNYQCMKRGIGVGSNLPYDTSFAGGYVPVDPRKFYCGNAVALPVAGGHFAVGSPSKCMQIGVGVGKAQRAGKGAPWGMTFFRYYLPYILFILIAGGIFTLLYFVKPKFIIKKDSVNNKFNNKFNWKFNWKLFIPYYLFSCLLLVILIWWFWKNFVRRWI
jgi:hypothetical protein